MEHQPFPAQPETAWYEGRLRKTRRLRLVVGIVFLCVALSFFIGELIQFPFHDVLSLVAFVVFSLLLIWFGGSAVLANRGPVPVEDINQLRQHERSTLFRQAQGALPWQYQPWVRLVELLLAVFSFWLAAGHTILVTPGRAQWVLGGIYLIAGFLLLVDVFYFKPRRAGRLAARSAWELSSRLSAGEASGDSHSDPDA
jgi:hypothetical protein